MFVIEVHMNLETFFIRTPSNLIPYAPIANLDKKKRNNEPSSYIWECLKTLI